MEPLPPHRPVVHIAGFVARVNYLLRQRCAWCDVILVDYDLERVAVPVGQEGEPNTWPLGSLVLIDGPVSYTVEPTVADINPGNPVLPDNACAVTPQGRLAPKAPRAVVL